MDKPTALIAPSDYEHLFHQKPSDKVKEDGQEQAKEKIQPSSNEGKKSNDPLAVTGQVLRNWWTMRSGKFLALVPQVFKILGKK